MAIIERATRPEEALETLVKVLNEVRLGRARSRSDIRHRSGLSRAIVAQRISELVARGLVRDEGAGTSTGGRRPRRLAFDAGAGHVLAADVGATSIDVAVTDLGGRVLGHMAEDGDIATGPARVLSRVDLMFSVLLDRIDGLPGELWGVGVGIPGPVEFRSGRPTSPPIMPGWDGFPIRQFFADRCEAPTWVDNDVNVMALGEWRRGIAQGHDDVVVLKIGTGIGAGLISNGLLHRGAEGAAGDVGHIQVVDDPSVICRCGNIGCLEAVAGGAALAREGARLARTGGSQMLRRALDRSDRVTAADVGWAAAHGDAASIELLHEAGREIGKTLAGIVNVFNPSLVIVGGGVASSGDHLLAAIRQVVYGRSLPLATREMAIKLSELGPMAGVTGVAAMVLDQLFAVECLARWIDDGSPARRPEVAEAAATGVSGR